MAKKGWRHQDLVNSLGLLCRLDSNVTDEEEEGEEKKKRKAILRKLIKIY